jgi:hypothetical protein
LSRHHPCWETRSCKCHITQTRGWRGWTRTSPILVCKGD